MKRSMPDSSSATRALLSLLLPLALLSGCSDSASAPKRGRAGARVPVTVAAAQQRSVPLIIAATGTVEPMQIANVGSQVGGVVTQIRFREGADVSQGQVLIQLDARPFKTAYDQAQAALARDRAQAENARLDAERSKKLVEQNVISAAEWDQKRAASEAAAAVVSGDQAAANNARLNLQYASIRAPISGRTGKLQVHVGDLVKAASSDPLVTVNQIHPVRVAFTVPESAVPQIQRYRAGKPKVLARTGSDSTDVEGTLAFVDNGVDPSTGTLLLKGEFANQDGRLWPGQFVEVKLVLTVQHDVVTVPAPAVVNGQQGTYVYVLNADSTTSSRPVTVARTDDVMAVIASGLKPGETVITDGQFRIGPGAKVVVREAVGGQRQ